MANKKTPPWWQSGTAPVTPINGFTRVFRPPPADAERPGHRRRMVDQGQTLSQRLGVVPIGLTHLYGIVGRASQQLTVARSTARALLAQLVAELLGGAPVDPHDDAALLSALAELVDAEPQPQRRAYSFLDHAYAAGLPMADAAEFVQIVDTDLRGIGVAIKELVPKSSALALVLGMVRT